MGKDQTLPYGTVSRLNLFQAKNCLATISQSLRDKGVPRQFAPSPFRPFAASLLYGTVPALHEYQAINCLDFGELSRVATIMSSLRDKSDKSRRESLRNSP